MRLVPSFVVGVVALLLPCTASAAVQIGPSQIVVTGDGARATIDRAPFRIAYADGGGSTVLQQVANERPAPFPVAPVPEPQPAGSDDYDAPTLYAPLTFTVGAQRSVEYPSTQYTGNLLTAGAAGVQFSARDVESAEPAGDGVRLVVGTSDPTGRKLVVTVAPGSPGTLRVSARPTPDAGVVQMADAFVTREGEPFRGFGGRHNLLDQRGTDFFNWLEQENLGAGTLQPATSPQPGTGGDRYMFPNGPHAAYYVQSLFYGARYGFLLDRTELSRWRMASDRQDAWQTQVAAPAMDYVVAPGDMKQAIPAMTRVNGRNHTPPDWALGPLLVRSVKYPPEEPEGYKRSLAQDLEDFDRYKLPLDGYRIEGWAFLSDEELRREIAELRRRGIRSMVYFRLFTSDDKIGTEHSGAFQEAIAKGYVAKRPDGRPYTYISNFNSESALIDFTNPEAVAWWKGRIKRALELGADGFQEDFGEQALTDMRFHDGRTGAQLHNELPTLAHKASMEAIREFERENPGREIFTYTRAGYSGSPGAAAYEWATFAGDSTTDWSRSSGLQSLATDMLNRAVGGVYGFNTDIGGYFDTPGIHPPTTKELFIRWAQWATLSPIFRLHGSVFAGTHTPWTFDQETVDIYNRLSEFRRQVRPLLKRLWQEAERTGIPPTRPLWLEFPDDPEAAKQDQQWLLGPDVLVAPVVEEGATSRDVYFPRGCWQHPETGQRVEGPRSVRIQAALDELPYFFRCGAQPFRATAAGGATLPSQRAARSCASRRNFRIRLRRDLVSARVLVDGKRVRTVKADRRTRRIRSRVDLRGLPRGRFTVRIVGRTKAGRTVVRFRAYRTCVPRRRA